jgi:tetratricopeptide (TPR) repeat protein
MRLIKSADLEQLHFAATNYKLTQQYALAEESYRKLIVLEENLFGPETSTVALNTYNLAEVLVHQQRYAEARTLLQQAVMIWEKAYPNDYLSLLSYTEAVNIVKRQTESAAAAQQPVYAEYAPAQQARLASVLPMRRRTASSAVHVA